MYNQITHAAFLDLLHLYNNRFMCYANDLVKMVVRILLYVWSLSRDRGPRSIEVEGVLICLRKDAQNM